MYSIVVLPYGRVLKMETPQTLLNLLTREKIYVESPCRGAANCGKCRLKVVDGNLPPLTEDEKNILRQDEIDAGFRLACKVTPVSDMIVEIDKAQKGDRVLTSGTVPFFVLSPAVSKTVIELSKPTLKEQKPYEQQLYELAPFEDMDCLLMKMMPSAPGCYTAVFNGKKLIGIEKGDTSASVYGLALDIGTTTVVMSLVDLITGEELAAESSINVQKVYGSDVLTRITYAQEFGAEGVEALQKVLLDSINTMAEELCLRCSVDKNFIYDIVVSANATMLHTLLGVDPSPIGSSPYAPVFTKSKNISAFQLGLKFAPGAMLYCIPSVSSYIGADIVSGVIAAGLQKRDGNILFIDIGTNGEIVLSRKGELISCSCAAGPAFEGMNISCGMRAADGAVEELSIDNGCVTLKVIGGTAPEGICGSGILAAIRELVKIGLISADGKLLKENCLDAGDCRRRLYWSENGKRGIKLSGENGCLGITVKDIRQVQLAKGAILSGFYALLERAGLVMSDLDEVVIAGQFGAYLSSDSLVGCGILPYEVRDKITYIGNSSKTGAYMALMSVDVREEMEKIAGKIDYMELSAYEGYEKLFVKSLQFPQPEKESASFAC